MKLPMPRSNSRRCVRLLVGLALAPRCFATPPLVTGDVPTADKGWFELYSGLHFERSETGSASRQIPSTELVYGLTDRQEITFEIACLSQEHILGIGDAVVGTKYQFLQETERQPGLAGSFELKLPTGSRRRGLGSGEFDYALRWRAQKTWGWFTAIGNAGYTFVTDPKLGAITPSTKNIWFLSCAQEYRIAKATRLLSEIYFVSRDAPGGPNQLAANIGFKHQLGDHLALHAAIGKSLRAANRGGPDLRLYAGLKWEFAAPWRRATL